MFWPIKYSNTTLVKVKCAWNKIKAAWDSYSNTTLVKVKCHEEIIDVKGKRNSNTTLVKVKFGKTTEYDQNEKFKYNTC